MNRILLSTVCVSAMLLGAGCKVTVVDGFDVPPYDECFAGDQCEFPTECFEISADGASASMCTNFCNDSLDCATDSRGFAGECISFDGGANFTCFEACRSSSECAPGWACKSATSDGTSFSPICLPI